ncbi:MAG TPA: peptidoglycan DD-metalloendopeptidase family protein [Gammaproteobacteria bacterium]|nr:peptidoglycan DD-metalloendopeptidase family protein [Gammaproteobacteria bacterium]
MLFSAIAAADQVPSDPREAEARLNEVRKRIKAMSERLTADRRDRDALASALHQAERRISDLFRELGEIEARLATRRAHLKSLEQNRDERRASVEWQRQELKRHLRAAYMLGRQDRLKLLLNQQDPAAVSRAFTYYGYFNRARARRIRALRQEIAALAQVEIGIREETSELERLKQRNAEARTSLEAEHARRRKTIAMLNARIEKTGSQMARLEEDARRLSELIKKLEEELADLSIPLDIHQAPFSELKGKLPWPIPGRIRHRFGTPREGGDLRWQGVVISGKRGEPVQAISYGRVAFADWLRGFGFLVILDHGAGYMSLYGYAQTLSREVGDWVQAGEIIAAVGDSGGQTDTALYFEIRHNGTPSNPAGWCSRAATAALVSP